MSQGTTPNAYRYTGQQSDADSGLLYLRARYYEPSTGRFMSQDPYKGDHKVPATLNLYVYCRNNPIKLTDPSGYKDKLDNLANQQDNIPGLKWDPLLKTWIYDPPLVDNSMDIVGAVPLFFTPGGAPLKITGFTKHGINQVITRGICPKALIKTVNNPKKFITQLDGTFKYVGKEIVVILNETGKVVTAWKL